MKFSDKRFKETMHIGCIKTYEESPIYMQLSTISRYDSTFNEWLTIEEAEQIVKLLQVAIEKAKLLKKEVDSGEEEEA